DQQLSGEVVIKLTKHSMACLKERGRKMYRELLEEAIKELEPEIKAVCAYHVMGSEDFAYISREIPSSYMCIGAGIEDVS
ncbi:hypothetical protein, partial [Eggerthella lenta]|uniref:hypothetical protein n=1 Tax=Eggerthella lenta TaxID=84112 RepID=UPI001D080138